MTTSAESIQAAYDGIVDDYDRRWSVHLRAPQGRLTAALGLAPGMRCVDLGCGTGVETLEMVRLAAPGEVVGVDCSPGMLEIARRRAESEGLALTTHCRDAEDFIRSCEFASYDVITLRFCVAYLDWRNALAKLPPLLRAGGRIGILNNLAHSGAQAYDTYRGMVRDLGLPDVPVTAPQSLAQIEAELRRGGAAIELAWTYSFRLWFESGEQVASWLQESGFAAHPALQALPPELAQGLWRNFSARVESYREARGLPLDFEVAGVVAAI